MISTTGTRERTVPIGESTVSKVNGELAVGENLAFQRLWWHFERVIWCLFAVVIALDLAGAFGRGPLAKASVDVPNKMHVDYERIERYGTPSILHISLGPAAQQD